MFKVDVEPLAPRLLNNRTVHSDYLRITQEQAAILREVELLILIKQTCPSINNSSDKLVDVTLKNKDKRVRFTEPVTSSGNTNTKTTSSLNLVSCAIEPKVTATLQHSKLNANSELICVKCNGCMLFHNHDLCVPNVINDVNARAKSKSVKKLSKRKVWKPIGKYLDSGYSKHMTGDRSQLTNFVNKFLGIIRFRNDHVAKIMGYGDYQIGNIIISRVYYMEGLGHNLFFIRQFCDSNLEVAFRQHTCYIRNLEGVDLLNGSRGKNLYILSLGDMVVSFPICILSKASKSKSWLWHRRLSHLNFGTINRLARHDLVQDLPKLKFKKDHLCSACAMEKSMKKPHKPKSKDTNQEKLYLLHIDLCGPMRVASVNEKKYILVIVDDYSRFTWVKCLRSKDKAPYFIIKFLKMIQVRLKTPVHRIRTDNEIDKMVSLKDEIIRPYELLHEKLPDVSFFHVFGALFYLINDSENLGKLQPKDDISIFISYAPTKKVFQIYNRHTRRIIKTILVDFDELTAMASEHSSSKPALHEMTPAIISSGLVPNPPPSTYVDYQAPEVIALIAELVAREPTASASSPSSTTVDQDAPSPSKLKEEVHISQPKGFVDQDNPSHVYKIKKALYDLKQADMLSRFLISQHFSKGAVDPTLFTWKAGNELLLDTGMSLTSFANADHVGCQDSRRSTSGSAQFLGDKLISWSSKKQKCTTISSTEAEYIALFGCCAQILWIRLQLTDYGFQFNKIPLYCDNKSAIALCCNSVQHSRAKHIDVRCYFIKEQVENGIMKLHFLGIKNMSPDTLKRLAEKTDE
nr:retrovirus-related Pol polyprotein from transposon TNT 1-94 [Tanacetum cinerariifolium]